MPLRGSVWLCLGCCLFGLLLSACAHTNELKPFATDGCSLWLDGTPAQPNLWRHCCVAHDLAYWQGGSEAARKEADEAIQACVTSAQGKGMANYIYTNVRWGGSPYWMNNYRWGYGWNYFDGAWPRGYKEPTNQEQQQIDQALPAARQVTAEDAKQYPAQPAPTQNAHIGQLSTAIDF